MKSNPKTIAGVIVLVILAIALGFLLSRLFPTIGEVRREMSLTPTPLPEIPGSVMAVTADPSAPTPEPVLRTGSRGDDVKTLQSRLHDLSSGRTAWKQTAWWAPKRRMFFTPRRRNRRQVNKTASRKPAAYAAGFLTSRGF